MRPVFRKQKDVNRKNQAMDQDNILRNSEKTEVVKNVF